MGSLIAALEAPEAGVAVVAAIGPNERQAEPDALDETCSSGSPHGTALADGTLGDDFGKREMHGYSTTLRFSKYEEGVAIHRGWSGALVCW
jgi:hypothetical protein